MRATWALGLIFLAGCAAGMQHPEESILDPGPGILHINGTFEPVTFVVTRKRGTADEDQRPNEPLVRPRPKMPRSKGTAWPKAVVPADTHTIVVIGRGPCQTNDPMPNGRPGQPIEPMPRSHPLRVAPMPNACPVTVPWSSTTVVFSSAPVTPKTAPAPAPAEPQP